MFLTDDPRPPSLQDKIKAKKQHVEADKCLILTW